MTILFLCFNYQCRNGKSWTAKLSWYTVIKFFFLTEVEVIICDFHRKQAWRRWTSAHKNAVIDHQDEIMSLLNVRT